MKCLKNCIFMLRSKTRPKPEYSCLISWEKVKFGETCPYENKTVTELNMMADYNRKREVIE